MPGTKVCIDIGGTKTIFAVVDKGLNIKKQVYEYTPKTLPEFKKFFENNLKKLKDDSDIVNISIAGRFDEKGSMVFCPNLPLKGFNIKKFASKYFKNVNIENDANCFAVYEIFKGYLRDGGTGMIIVWGTGVGGSLVFNRKIFHGSGFASEVGHIGTMIKDGEDIETLIGGRHLKKRYGHDGLELHNLAEKGNKAAINSFKDIGRKFGRYLSSISYMIDPEIVVLGGSFGNSWKFMKDSVNETIKNRTIRKKLKVRVVKGKFYVIKGCYFLDEYEKLHNKL